MSFFSLVHNASRAARGRSPVTGFALSALCVASTGTLAQSSEPSQGPSATVVVTATRFARDADDLPFGVSVLSAAEIQAAGVTTVNEAIMKLLGVVGRQDFYGGGNYGLDLRGFGGTADSNQVVVVDGVRINEADLSGTRLAGIAIDSVERIEVIRGSGAVLYGEGATGGVIVIITKAGRGQARQNQANVYAAAGRYGVREARGTATVTAGDFSLDVAANRRNADNHRDNFRSKTDGASVAGQWRRDGLRLGLRHAVDHLDTGLPGSLTGAQYATNPRQASTPSDSAHIDNARTGVFGEAMFGDWQVGIDVASRNKSLASKFGTYDYVYDVSARTYAVLASHTARFGAVLNNLIIGFDQGEWTRKVPGIYGSVANQDTQAVYLKDEATLAGGTRLSAGWRTEDLRVEHSNATTNIDRRQQAWELGLVQPVLEGVAVFGRLGRSFRLANVDEFSFTSPGVTLVPQTSRDAEVGARWRYAGGRAELRLYRSALSDEIGYDPNAVGPYGPGANVNFDPTRRTGAEIEVIQALSADVNLRAQAATRTARFAAGPYDGKDVPLTPRRSLSARIDWSPALGHRIDAGVNLVSSQSPDFDNACTMPGYTTADLRYAYQWQRAELAVAVNNVADTKYYTQAFACVSGQVGAIYPEAGRAAMVSLRMQF